MPIGGYVPNIEWYTGKDSSTPPVDVRDQHLFIIVNYMMHIYQKIACKKLVIAMDINV